MSGKLRPAPKIMVIRHAEKPSNDPPIKGVTLEGKREKESLIVRGWQRAGALASFFAPADGSLRHPSLAQPQFLYASKPTRREGSKRPMETLMPLADKLAMKINTKFRKLDAEAMVEEVSLVPGVVLICWQYEYIPQIANLILGNETTAVPDWPDDRFDLVWVFDREPTSGRYNFVEVPQNLLMGDSAKTIK